MQHNFLNASLLLILTSLRCSWKQSAVSSNLWSIEGESYMVDEISIDMQVKLMTGLVFKTCVLHWWESK